MTEAILIILGGLFLFCFVFWKAIKFECGADFCKTEKKTPTYIVLTVKNNEDCIEGVIRSLINELRFKNNPFVSSNILVIDLGSEDNTIKILERLSNKYEFIHILHSSSYIDIVSR